jgi:hypothetical protein
MLAAEYSRGTSQHVAGVRLTGMDQVGVAWHQSTAPARGVQAGVR